MANYKTYTAGTYADSDELKKSKQNADHWNQQQFKEFTYDDFKDSDRTTGYLNQLDNLQGPGDFSFSKQQGWDNIMNQILSREKFTYDVNGDALYQQYKDQYVNQGKMAMMDTMGQAAAMTGGYGNSYAQSVGQQAYQGYLQQLTDKIPELYQLAMSKYQMEGDELYNQYSLYSDQYNTEYGQHRDAVSDYQADRSHLGDMWSASHAVDMDTYTANRDTAKAEVDSYNSIISENRQTWNAIVTDLRNSEWGKYVDKETLAQKAIDIYNDTIYKNVQEQQAAADLAEKIRANKASESLAKSQLDYKALEEKYEGYISPEDLAKMQKAESSAATKTFKGSILTETELKRRNNQTTVGGKTMRFDNHTQYVDAVIEKQYKEGKLTENEVAYLKGYYGID